MKSREDFRAVVIVEHMVVPASAYEVALHSDMLMENERSVAAVAFAVELLSFMEFWDVFRVNYDTTLVHS
ncbi:hypothetical protein HGB07_05740 [Candidatus Roizmanbacteria bacterium]|nr:hypothetical protein [Candidatus Roizmanbacteria bacterium]